MYQALLTRRYLTSKVMPLLAVAAVMLCTAMVLIVWSVMAGFLATLLSSGRTLIGDVEIARPTLGMPYYEDLLRRLEADPMVEAAAPTLESVGLLGLPSGDVRMVRVVGVDGESYDRVTGYGDSLWWRPLAEPAPGDRERKDQRLKISEGYEQDGLRLTEADPATGRGRAAAVPGVMVSGYNQREEGGWLRPRWWFMPDEEVTLSVLPVSQQGAVVSVEARRFPVANEFRANFYEFDANMVLVRIDAVQEMLRLHAARRFEGGFDFGEVRTGESGNESFAEPELVGESPARVTSILLRAADGVSPARLRDRAEEIYREYAAAHEERTPRPASADAVYIQTWEERPGVRDFVLAVKKETALVLSLFGFISLTAAFLVCAIFWAMVSEKTKDIGILRSLGAGGAGVAWIYVRFGVVIGVVGSALGGTMAWVIVRNINPIHEWMGRALGIVVWDPRIYYFTKIPNEVDPVKAAWVLAGGVLFSALGALLPALKAARLDPVKALRFE